ncbi:hypothetical protein vcoNHCC006C_000237A, partial [Vibrio cholerae O1 str. NHCC-006C]
MRLLLVTPP